MNKKKARNGGMGIVSFLTILFIILKVTDVIPWSWILVFSPIWISAICAVLLVGIVLVAYNYCNLNWLGKYGQTSAPASVASVYIIPYIIGIAVCIVLSVLFLKKRKI